MQKMRIGLISDVHGNISALEKCFKYLKKETDEIIFLGDAIGYLPSGYECFHFLLENNVACIKGNHEEMLLGNLPIKEGNKAVYKLEEVRNKFLKSDTEKLNQWPIKIERKFNNLKYLFVHGSPSDYTNGYIYPDTDLSEYALLDFDCIITAHTHRPFIKQQANKCFGNIGSVGLPRDTGMLSSFGILDLEKKSVEIKRMELDKNTVQEYLKSTEIHPLVKKVFTRNSNIYIGKLII
jgi:putative phosphoesterase